MTSQSSAVSSTGQAMRIRSDLAWGLSSFLVAQYLAFDVDKAFKPSQSGFVMTYENSLPGLPWANPASSHHPARSNAQSVGFGALTVF
jgi:hypothetical protein